MSWPCGGLCLKEVCHTDVKILQCLFGSVHQNEALVGAGAKSDVYDCLVESEPHTNGLITDVLHTWILAASDMLFTLYCIQQLCFSAYRCGILSY